MRILLLWPKARKQLTGVEALGWGTEGAIAEPLALEYLAAGAAADGHAVRILDLRLHPDDLDSTLLEFMPDVVGVTAYSLHVLTALDICRRVKQLLPQCWTVAGGHHATLMPEDFFEPQIDFVVVGEGVAPLRNLLRELDNGGAINGTGDAIPGLWARSGDGFDSGGEQPPVDLDSLPFPNRRIVGHDRSQYFIDRMKPVGLVRTTVGCPFRCSFCSLWKIMSGHYHIRANEAVVRELQEIDEEWVFLVDDEAFINGKRMAKLAQAIESAGLRKQFFAYCRIDTLLRQREVLAQWRRIGLRRLFIGIEAITDDMLREFDKKLALVDIQQALEAARQLDIDVMGQFIVRTDASPRDFKRMARFIEHNRIRYPSFTILTPIPGTNMLEDFDSVLELQPNGRPNWDLFDCQTPVTETRLPKDQFMDEYHGLQRLFSGRYENYWRPAARSETGPFPP